MKNIVITNSFGSHLPLVCGTDQLYLKTGISKCIRLIVEVQEVWMVDMSH